MLKLKKTSMDKIFENNQKTLLWGIFRLFFPEWDFLSVGFLLATPQLHVQFQQNPKMCFGENMITD